MRTRKASFQLSLSFVGAIGLRQVTLLFHPQDPLAIAVDRLRTDPSVVVFQPKNELAQEDNYHSVNLRKSVVNSCEF